MIRLSASCVAISLDPDVTVRTQAVYPRLLTRRTSTRLLFYLTPRRDCRVSPPIEGLSPKGTVPKISARLCGSDPSPLPRKAKQQRDGHYPLRCPPELGLSSPPKAGRPPSTCPVYQGPIPSLLYSPVYPHPDSLAGEYVLWKPL